MRARVAREVGADARSMVTGVESVTGGECGDSNTTTTWTENEPHPFRRYLNGGELSTTWGGSNDSGRKSSTLAMEVGEEGSGSTETDHLTFDDGEATPRLRFLTTICAAAVDVGGGGRGLCPHTMQDVPTRSRVFANVHEGQGADMH